MGALLWGRHRDHFVHMIRYGAPMMSALILTGLATRRFWIFLRLTTCERGGLELAGTQRRLPIRTQPFILWLETVEPIP
jgi:hypothetical protein